MADRLMTIEQAAPLLGAKPLTVYRMVWSGVIDAVDISRPGSKRPAWRIAQTAIDKLARGCANSSKRST